MTDVNTHIQLQQNVIPVAAQYACSGVHFRTADIHGGRGSKKDEKRKRKNFKTYLSKLGYKMVNM
jgi:hypothetical protein